MANDQLRVFIKYFPVFLKYGLSLLFQRVQALIHRYTWKPLPSSQNVVVVGGSFAGITLARRLAESLPSGYKVVLIEKNSHFNYTFDFPRYSVLPKREQRAFIPYTGIMANAPKGIFEQLQDMAINVLEGDVVELASGRKIPFAYLAIATGVTQSPPTKLWAREKAEACAELRALQAKILDARRIAVVGAGAVGVQMAGDIKSFYPEKSNMGIGIVLGERPELPRTAGWEGGELTFKGDREEQFDLIISCTGQTPNSSLLEQSFPTAISSKTKSILVKPTLQLHSVAESNAQHHNMFSLGDVAETGGPKMARAGMVQADIVQRNILALINGRRLKAYKPMSIEGSLKLSPGKVSSR
ncbi:Fe-regulated protein [Lachnellula occidentalis]|uniref:Fe-regulated protein n=1 Tax=Lachnellula occidentalis TaxID=215460 RepID=A0A8H8RYI9_9HELO|nr:Fe-regulated protein [Lachnellula occidentalis]